MAETVSIDNGQIIIAVRIDDITYALGTEDFDNFESLVAAARKTLENLGV